MWFNFINADPDDTLKFSCPELVEIRGSKVYFLDNDVRMTDGQIKPLLMVTCRWPDDPTHYRIITDMNKWHPIFVNERDRESVLSIDWSHHRDGGVVGKLTMVDREIIRILAADKFSLDR